MERQPPVGVTMLGLIVLVAGFLSWGTVTGPMQSPFGGDLFGQMTITARIDAWNGSIEPTGVSLPNALVVVAALALVLFAWLRHAGTWRAPRGVSLGLAIYALGHVAFLIVMLAGADEATVGVGALLTAAACVGLLLTAIKEGPAKDPVA